ELFPGAADRSAWAVAEDRSSGRDACSYAGDSVLDDRCLARIDSQASSRCQIDIRSRFALRALHAAVNMLAEEWCHLRQGQLHLDFSAVSARSACNSAVVAGRDVLHRIQGTRYGLQAFT